MQIFISHATADANLARTLSSALEQAGFSVWNPESILPGDNWAKETGGIDASELMVALFSKNAKGQTNVTQEVQFALTSGNYRGRVVPVLVDFATLQAVADVPWVLLKMDPIHITGASPDFGAVVDRVRKLAGAAANASH